MRLRDGDQRLEGTEGRVEHGSVLL
jgi:hypothetical protein